MPKQRKQYPTPPKPTTIEEFFNHTNFPELRRQHNTLFAVSCRLDLTPQEDERLNGLVCFLDGLRDLAADHYGHRDVFKPETGRRKR